ncbi:hypothetical protein F5Y10DRAFT_257091 [Nemania abortiva]|nr:hypothetical protein F5Y10DRAFT_257091 [Nemania abortiva]
MKTAVTFTAFLACAASMAISPRERVERDFHEPSDVHIPTVDGTSTRGQWVSSYSNDEKAPKLPTVDGTSTRGQWVSSYSNDEGMPQGPTVDETSTRGKWVTKYKEPGPHGPTVDETSTRGKWVTKYKAPAPPLASYGSQKLGLYDHWLPTGPGYLDVDELEAGYHAHLMIMSDSSSWLQSGLVLIKRIFENTDA